MGLAHELVAIIIAMVGSILIANVVITEIIPRLPISGPILTFIIGTLLIAVSLLIKRRG